MQCRDIIQTSTHSFPQSLYFGERRMGERGGRRKEEGEGVDEERGRKDIKGIFKEVGEF